MPRVGFEQKPLADGSLSVESFWIDDSVEELTPLVNRAQAGQSGSIWLPGRFQDMAAGMPTHFWVTFTWPKMRLEAFVQAIWLAQLKEPPSWGRRYRPSRIGCTRGRPAIACPADRAQARPGPIFSDLRTNGARRARREGAKSGCATVGSPAPA